MGFAELLSAASFLFVPHRNNPRHCTGGARNRPEPNRLHRIKTNRGFVGGHLRPPFPPFCLYHFHVIHLLLHIYRFCFIGSAPRAGITFVGCNKSNQKCAFHTAPQRAKSRFLEGIGLSLSNAPTTSLLQTLPYSTENPLSKAPTL